MRWHGIDGFHFSQGNQQSVIHFRSLTALTDVSDGGTWVTMTGVGNQHQPTYSDFTDVTIAGDDYLGHWWTMGVLSNSWGNLNFINFEYWGATPNVPLGWGNGYFTTVGKAVDLEADADKVSVDYNFFNPNLNYVGTAITYGNNVQGVNVVGGNIVGGDYGIFVPFNADTGTDQLTITGITISVRTADVQTLQGVFGTTISNSFLTCGPGGPATPSSPGLGIDLEGANSFSITGNVIECGDAGVGYGNDIVVANGGGGTIVGNTLGNSATAIWLKAASSNVYVANNYSQNVTNKVLNDGTNNSIDYDRIGLTFNNGIALFGRDTSGSPHPLIYLDGLNNLGLYNGKVQVYDTGDLGSSGSLLSNGNIALDGTGGDFIAHGHAGLDCSGTPTSGFATSSGIVTHC
jgi:hypothetical protein